MPTDTLIVILNYRTPDLTIQCLRSLSTQMVPNDRVVVVDGCSGDGSADRIAAAISEAGWWDWVSLMALKENRGYAAGNNAAIDAALAREGPPPRYVLLLNSDTIVREGGVRALVEFMDRHPRAGIAGSRLEWPDGTPQCAAFRFPTIASELEGGVRMSWVSRLLARRRVAMAPADAAHRADWVAGASFMIRSTVFQDIGLMDDGYFLYFEETDFCLRARRAGWESWYVPQSRVVHLVGQSTSVSRVDTKPSRRPTYWFESRRRYFCKNHGRTFAAVADLAWMVGFALWRLRRPLQRKPDNDPPRMLWDFFRNSALVRGAVPHQQPGKPNGETPTLAVNI